MSSPPSNSDALSPFDSRRNNFDFLRLFLAILVIYSHSYALGLGNEDGEILFRALRVKLFGLHMTLGALAVGGFFIISGFLITMSWDRRRSVWDYFKKRIARIFPGFLVAAALGAYLVPIYAGSSGTVEPSRFIAGAARLIAVENRGAFPTNIYPAATNGSLWSIPYEFWCYIAVAALGLSGLIARNSVLVVMFVASLAIAFAMAITEWNPASGTPARVFGVLSKTIGDPVFWARLAPFYLAGVVAHRCRRHIPLNGRVATIALLLLIAAAFVPAGWAVALPVCGAYLIFWFAFHPSIPSIPAARFGDLSYGTYLYGFPIQQTCVMLAGGSMHPLALLAASLPLSLLAGALSWHGVERWFLRSRKSNSNSKVS